MLLEDYWDALSMKVHGVVPVADWDEEMQLARAAASWDALG